MSRQPPLINDEMDRPVTGPLADLWSGTARPLVGRILDVLLPPRCAGCGVVVAGAGPLCAECWSEARLLGGVGCAVCGYPFAYDAGPDALCGGCIQDRPAYRRARAALAYDDVSRPLVLAFKHGDRTELAPPLARLMMRAGRDLIADAELIVPVPLHWSRQFMRRFNQAALLAQNLGRLSGVPVAVDLLARRRPTPSQGGLSAIQRKRNVAGAFVVPGAGQGRVAGRRVLLVDDVMTTGATAAAATRALLDAGAGAVDVLTLTRVIKEG